MQNRNFAARLKNQVQNALELEADILGYMLCTDPAKRGIQ